MIATFEERRSTVRALQLTAETVGELCQWTAGYVRGWNVVIHTRDGERIAYRSDWVVQANGNGGGFDIFTADRFSDLYIPQETT